MSTASTSATAIFRLLVGASIAAAGVALSLMTAYCWATGAQPSPAVLMAAIFGAGFTIWMAGGLIALLRPGSAAGRHRPHSRNHLA